MAPKMGYVGSPAFEVGDSRADLPDSSGSGRRGRAAGCHRVQRSGCSRRVAHRRQNVGTAHPPPPRPACSRPGGGKVGPVRRTPPPSAGVAPDALDALSTPQLCLAWRSSYLRLHRVTSSPADLSDGERLELDVIALPASYSSFGVLQTTPGPEGWLMFAPAGTDRPPARRPRALIRGNWFRYTLSLVSLMA